MHQRGGGVQVVRLSGQVTQDPRGLVNIFVILFMEFANNFVFKQKAAYEFGTGDWSSDVCSSDLPGGGVGRGQVCAAAKGPRYRARAGRARRGIGRASCRERG